MIRAFKNFWKDYFELCKMTGEWYKKHWIGYLILIFIVWGIELGYIFKDDIIEKIKSKCNKKVTITIE